jgi:hypothetical protein
MRYSHAKYSSIRPPLAEDRGTKIDCPHNVSTCIQAPRPAFFGCGSAALYYYSSKPSLAAKIPRGAASQAAASRLIGTLASMLARECLAAASLPCGQAGSLLADWPSANRRFATGAQLALIWVRFYSYCEYFKRLKAEMNRVIFNRDRTQVVLHAGAKLRPADFRSQKVEVHGAGLTTGLL